MWLSGLSTALAKQKVTIRFLVTTHAWVIWARSLVAGMGEATDWCFSHISVSLLLSPSLPLSLKNKTFEENKSTVHFPRVKWKERTHVIFFCVCSTSLGLELPGRICYLGHRALKNSSLPPHLQLVYLPGEGPLLCPQPFGWVGSMAHRAPIELGREHLRG